MQAGNLNSSIILIGGSAGSLPAIKHLLAHLPRNFSTSIVVILHRMKNAASDMDYLLTNATGYSVIEPEDKSELLPGSIFLAPQNYHLLAEPDGTISLDYSEAELHSRPSINITFESFSEIYTSRVVAFILSGLNYDGAEGLAAVIAHGGKGFILHPDECEFTVMPVAAKLQNPTLSYSSLNQLTNIITTESQ